MNVLEKWLDDMFTEVSPREFYRGIFPAGELDAAGAFTKGKYTGVVVAVEKGKKWNGRQKVKRYSLTDDLEAVDIAVASDDFCICSPLSYAGKQRTAEHARMLYAIAVDVDKIRVTRDRYGAERATGLINLWERHIMEVKRLPRPTYIVSSGTGLHLYYVLEKPLPLYEDIAFELQDYKRELTRLIWHDTIVDIKSIDEVQQEGIYQGFRMPGTITKSGGRARAFKTGERVTMEYLNSFVGALFRARKAKEHKRGNVKLAEAAEKWPGWYERRIVRGEKRGQWNISRNLYDWWKEQIKSGATVGHRYYCLMMLAVYAQKCSHYDAKHNPQPVTREELERDSFELLEYMEKLTTDENNHFTEDDILAALEAFDERWTTYPRNSVEYKSGITIKENKRNGRKQAEHIKLMNYIRDEINKNTEWNKAGNGRKSKAVIIEEWRQLNPEGTIKECIAETGLGKSTVYRHWDGEKRAYILQQRGISSASSAAADAAAREKQERKEQQRQRAEVAEQMQKAEKMLSEFEKHYSEIDGASAERDILEQMRQQLETLKGLSKRLEAAEDSINGSGSDQSEQ